MIWDGGIIPDTAFTSAGGTVTAGIATSSTPLLPQLAAAGYSPGDIQANAKLKKAPQYYD